jgi:hypothetical protein
MAGQPLDYLPVRQLMVEPELDMTLQSANGRGQ